MWPRFYARNRLINKTVLATFESEGIQDTWENRLVTLEAMRIMWEYLVPEDSELLGEYAKFMAAIDEEIDYNLDRCIETSCPR
jgi:hypothetical protein